MSQIKWYHQIILRKSPNLCGSVLPDIIKSNILIGGRKEAVLGSTSINETVSGNIEHARHQNNEITIGGNKMSCENPMKET